MNKLSHLQVYLILIMFGIVFYIPFTGRVHLFDWDEINFAESAREMIISGNYLDVQINFQPFWEKPPLFIWMQVASMKLFGINEFAARFPNAVCGIISLLVLFRAGRRFRDEKFALLWIFSFTASILPFFYFKSGIIDPWFNLFIFLGILHFAYYLEQDRIRRNLILSAFFLGLAILTKGPVALLIFILSFLVYITVKKFKVKTNTVDVLLFSLVLMLTGGFWFILEILNGNFRVIQDFITYQIRLFSTKDAGHGGFLLYHFVVLLAGVFPASVFALAGFRKEENISQVNSDFRLWMLILFWTVLLLFTVVKTKIVHYSSLCYFPLSFFSAIFLYRILHSKARMSWLLKLAGLSISFTYGLLITSLPLISKFRDEILNRSWVKDPFARGNLLADVEWTGFEPSIGIAFIASTWFFFLRINNKPRQSIAGILISSLVFAYLTIIFITPRIESFSQRAAIEFYKSVAREDAYITTLGFKSYAHLFYGEVKQTAHTIELTKDQLLKGPVDKPVYAVFKNSRRERYLKEYPLLEILYEKNGFVFAKRNEY